MSIVSCRLSVSRQRFSVVSRKLSGKSQADLCILRVEGDGIQAKSVIIALISSALQFAEKTQLVGVIYGLGARLF